jgi:hypothetical protein
MSKGNPERLMFLTEVETSVPLAGLCFTNGFVPKRLFLTLRKSPKTFYLICNKISHKHVAYANHPFLFAKNFARQTRHSLSVINTAQWLSKLERSGMCHSPKETRCCAWQPEGPRSAAHGNQKDLAPPSRWRANSRDKLHRLTPSVGACRALFVATQNGPCSDQRYGRAT